MKPLSLLLFLLFSSSLFSQPKALFNKTVYDFGTIEKGSAGIAEFSFTNTGTEPIVISNVNSSCGCLVPYWPKEPVLPGKKGTIKAHYDTQRMGRFEKTLSVYWNVEPRQLVLKIKGEVVLPFTSVELDANEKDIGDLNYGETKALRFSFRNTGLKELKLYCYSNNFPDGDVIICKVDHPVQELQNGVQVDPAWYRVGMDTGNICIVIRNIHGNTGPFKRKIKIQGNAKDELVFWVKGNFTSGPKEDSLVESGAGNWGGSTVSYFRNGALYLVKNRSFNGEVSSERYYRGSDCYLVRTFYGSRYKENPWVERYYKEGELTEDK